MPGETSVYDFPYPLDSENPDGPLQVKALAEKLEATVWLPGALATAASVSAEASMAKPAASKLVVGGGSGEMKTLAAGSNGQVVTLIFGASVTVKNGTGNIVLAYTGDMAAVSGSVLTLIYNTAGSAWVEVSRGGIPTGGVTAAKLATDAVEAAKIKADAVETAKVKDAAVTEPKVADGAVTSRKMKPTIDIQVATSNVGLGAEYGDVPGTTLEITPTVASILYITAIFGFESAVAGDIRAEGTMRLDAEDLFPPAFFTGEDNPKGATTSQIFKIPLTAAKHTIKMRVRKAGGFGTGELNSDYTRYQYLLVAS